MYVLSVYNCVEYFFNMYIGGGKTCLKEPPDKSLPHKRLLVCYYLLGPAHHLLGPAHSGLVRR